MSNKKPILALIALILLAAQSAATVAFAAPAQVVFNPTQGEPRDYRVGVRVQPEDGGDGSNSRGEWLALQSVMRYRVSAGGLMSTTHIEPRFMQAENESGPLFSSARGDDLEDTSIPRLMRDGFDLAMDRDGKSTRPGNSNREAWQAVADKSGVPVSQLEQQLVAPALAQTIPARQGAQLAIDGFQGMPTLRLTVTEVDSDSLIATLTRTDDVPRPPQPMSDTRDSTSTRVTHVDGRLRIDRDSGWIQAMTLISDRQIERTGGTTRLHSVVTMEAVDDPATGTMGDGLREFRTNAMSAAMPDYDMYLPETAEDTLDRPVIEPPTQPLAHAETGFHIDEDGALVLNITHRDDENVSLDQLALDALTLRDADGKTLDQGFVLDSIAPDHEQDDATRIRLLPLGWQAPDPGDIAEVEASVTYQPINAPRYVSLPLRDTPTRLDNGVAHAEAVPTDDGWLVSLTGGYNTYYTYGLNTVFKGRSATTTNRARDGINFADRILLERVDDPDIWGLQFELTGDIDAFDLMFYSPAEPSTHALTFTRDAPER
ncbi:hypothetical protein [Salinisphaera aquimarina]|uniref:Uncharacterized protein n=1 Tax=Salinisphaera aquimarina TaxID=2094031 RepID=A0ABV7EKL2_9GAMM